MRVILHADDFGYDKDTTGATIDLLDKGILSSATIMSKMPATDIALEYAKVHPEKSFGVHLTFVDGLEPCSRDAISLLDKNGVFLPSNTVRKKALMFNIKNADIVNESLSQIKALSDVGINVSHLDSHGHLHKFPSFLFALKEITKLSGIDKVRRVQNIFVNKPKTSLTTILNRIFATYIEKNFTSTKFFYMSANNFDTNWADTILKKMDELPKNSVIEIGVHPGHEEEWRQNEYDDIIDFYRKLGESGKHEIINWNQL